MSDEILGREVGRYKILELIGKGGMATVYKAYDTRLEREVAIKFIKRDNFPVAELDMLHKRFEREARSLGRLLHPNIVHVIDYGEFKDIPYLVMVYVPGGTLEDQLGMPIPWRKAIQMLLPIAHALQYVHDQDIINRDIKPSNILLTKNGEPLLTDFGLVKIYGDKAKNTTNITVSGAGLGTPDYMAPEQWIGETTAQSDLYSLGVVLYEMITGHPPYKAETPAGVLLKQANEPLPLPTDYVPDLPRDVESVMLKVLAKDPENRYPDIHVFISELNKLLTGETVTASSIRVEKLRAQMTGTGDEQPTPAPSKRKKIISSVLLLVGGLALVAVIGGSLLRNTNPDLFYSIVGPLSAPFSRATATATPTLKTASPTAVPPTSTETATASPTPSATFPPPTATATPFPIEVKDDQGVPMRLIPAGEFTMGDDDSKDAWSKPAHTVYLDAFYIDKFEVTNEMYAKCDSPECRVPKLPGSLTRSVYYRNPLYANHPVLYVDWWMARAYCVWRGARLPTEAEWEKAARGTDGRVYPWTSQERNCFYSNLAGCEDDTSAVNKFEQGQSSYGVYDLSGNVWEWTSSLFSPYPYDPDDGREALTGAGKRVLRGGSFHMFGVQTGAARNDTRFEMDPTYYGAYVGVRCAMDVETE